jgi:hypothetical protein
MAEKTIKILQFWYTADMPGPGGTTVKAEQIASRGQTVDITDDYDLQRGEEQDAFMSADELKAFETEGTPYDLATAEEPSDAAPFDWENASPEDMADFMEDQSLNVNQVLEVAHAHPDKLDEILEAEGIVTEDSPRKGVVEGIERIAAQQSE